MNRHYLAIVLLITPFLLQAETFSDPALTVKTGDNTYFNKMLGVTVTKPPSWYAQSVEELVMTQMQGSKALSGDDQNMRAMLDAAAKSSLPLFGFYEYPPGTPGKLNPNVLSVAENIKMYPAIKDPCDYIQAVKSILNQGQLKYSFAEKCEHTSMSGKNAGYLDAWLKLGKVTIYQRYYAILKGDHAVSFILTYTDDESHKKVSQVFDTIKISP